MEDRLLLYQIIIRILRYSQDTASLTTDEKKELLNEYAIANIIDELLEDNNYDKIDLLISKLDIDSIFLRKMNSKELYEIASDYLLVKDGVVFETNVSKIKIKDKGEIILTYNDDLGNISVECENGSVITPFSERFTMSTSAACSSMDIFLWITPSPP